MKNRTATLSVGQRDTSYRENASAPRAVTDTTERVGNTRCWSIIFRPWQLRAHRAMISHTIHSSSILFPHLFPPTQTFLLQPNLLAVVTFIFHRNSTLGKFSRSSKRSVYAGWYVECQIFSERLICKSRSPSMLHARFYAFLHYSRLAVNSHTKQRNSSIKQFNRTNKIITL